MDSVNIISKRVFRVEVMYFCNRYLLEIYDDVFGTGMEQVIEDGKSL